MRNSLKFYIYIFVTFTSCLGRERVAVQNEKHYILSKRTVAPQVVITHNNLNKLYQQCLKKGDYINANLYLREQMQAAEKNLFDQGLAESYRNKAILEEEQRNIFLAVEYYLRALAIYESLGNYREAYKIENSIGHIYYDTGNYKNALLAYQKAFKNLQKTSSNPRFINSLISITRNIGIAYQALNDFENSALYYQKALNITKDTVQYQEDFSHVYHDIAYLLFDQREYEKAIPYYVKALKIRFKLNKPSLITMSYNNLSRVYINKGDYKKAMDCLQKGFREREKEKKHAIEEIDAVLCRNMGELYFRTKNYKEAIIYLEKAKYFAETLNLKVDKLEAYQLLSELHMALGNKEQVLVYNNLVQEISQSVNLEKEVALIKIAEAQKSLAGFISGKIRTHKVATNIQRGLIISVIIFTLLLFITFFIYYLNHLQFKQAQDIENQSIDIQETIKSLL